MLSGSTDWTGPADLPGPLSANSYKEGKKQEIQYKVVEHLYTSLTFLKYEKASFSISVYGYESILGALKHISESSCLIEQDYRCELSTVQRIKSFYVKRGCQWQVISQGAARASSCLPHYSAHIHHLQNAIIPLKTPLRHSLKDAPVCILEPKRKWLSAHRCVIVIVRRRQPPFLFWKGKTLRSFSLRMYQNIKRRWEAHCLVIISHGRSPLSVTHLCLICLGRC